MNKMDHKVENAKTSNIKIFLRIGSSAGFQVYVLLSSSVRATDTCWNYEEVYDDDDDDDVDNGAKVAACAAAAAAAAALTTAVDHENVSQTSDKLIMKDVGPDMVCSSSDIQSLNLNFKSLIFFPTSFEVCEIANYLVVAGCRLLVVSCCLLDVGSFAYFCDLFCVPNKS